MTAAALILALATLLAPSPRRRVLIPVPHSDPGRRRLLLVLGSSVSSLVAALVIPASAVVACAAVLVTALLRRRRSAAKARRSAEATELQGALAILVGELRVGAHPVTAFETAADEVTGMVAGSLRGVAAHARLGADVAAGLRGVAEHSTLPSHWERLAVCWQLAQTHGLGIAALMRAAQRDVVERERFTSRASAGMAGARATATVLAGLPVLGIGLGQLIGAEPLRFLLSGEAGGWLLPIGVGLACCGLLWSDRITDGALK